MLTQSSLCMKKTFSSFYSLEWVCETHCQNNLCGEKVTSGSTFSAMEHNVSQPNVSLASHMNANRAASGHCGALGEASSGAPEGSEFFIRLFYDNCNTFVLYYFKFIFQLPTLAALHAHLVHVLF